MPVNTVSADQVQRTADGSRYIQQTPATNHQNNRFRPRRDPHPCRAQQLTPLLDIVEEGEAIAMDVEGVELRCESSDNKKGVGRVSIVNEAREVVYDVFVYYPENVDHLPPPKFLNLGVYWYDILPKNGARPVEEVLRNAKSICQKAGAVVCHALNNEVQYMKGGNLLKTVGGTVNVEGFDLKQFKTFDTQDMYGRRALRKLTYEVLGRTIQGVDHSSVEDAQATMELYLHHKNMPVPTPPPSPKPVAQKKEAPIPRTPSPAAEIQYHTAMTAKGFSWAQIVHGPACATAGALESISGKQTGNAPVTMESFLLQKKTISGATSPSNEFPVQMSDEEVVQTSDEELIQTSDEDKDALTTSTSHTSLLTLGSDDATVVDTSKATNGDTASETVRAMASFKSEAAPTEYSATVVAVESHAAQSNATTTVQSYAAMASKPAPERPVVNRSWAQIASNAGNATSGSAEWGSGTRMANGPVKFYVRKPGSK